MNWKLVLLILTTLFFIMFSLFKKPNDEALPWSGRQAIYDFISSNIDSSSGCLVDPSIELPDAEKRFKEGEVRWVAGGMDGAFGHHGGGGSDDKTANQIAELLISIAKRGKKEDKVELYKILENDSLIDYIDPALDIVISEKLPIEPHLHEFSKFLVKDSPDRGPIKLGLALLGLIRNENDKVLINVLGKHEEFTLFSAVALTNSLENPEEELFDLAKCVNGWGKIHLVERLASTENTQIKEWLIREGFKNSIMYEYLAYTCAKGGELHIALNASSIDKGLFDSCGDILEALINGGPAQDINDYEEAANVVSSYLHHFTEFPKSLKHFLVLHSIKQFLLNDSREEEDRFKNGWTDESRNKILSQIDRLLDSPEWYELIQTALKSDNDQEFYDADRAAKLLGIETWDIHWKRLQDDPSKSSNWYSVMNLATPENIEQILDFADSVLPHERIATGPADDMGLGPEYEWHSCLDFIIQDLDKFPGKGKKLILTGLRSPVIRGRNMAIKALSSWDHNMRDSEINDALNKAYELEPDEDVKERIKKVLKGERI